MKNVWVPLSGAIAQQTKVDTHANNIANANTPGFKQDQAIFKEHLTALERVQDTIDLPNKTWSPEDFYKTQSAENGFVKVDGTYTNFSQGQLTPTSNPLDAAIQGNGFFEVLTPNGIRYTRKGSFSVSKDGILVNEQGFPIMSKMDPNQLNSSGEAPPQPTSRIINTGNQKISINNEGDIYSNNNLIGSLSIVEFNDLHYLKKEGSALFINNDNKNIKTTSTTSTVHQGFIEESNVNAMSEMSELIKAHRHFESIQQAIKAYDNIAGRAANDITKF